MGPRGRLSDLPLHFLTRRYIDPADPRALTHGKPGQPLVWPGQFVFGYATQQDDEGGPGPIAGGGPEWMRNGSFLVFRRLRQDAAAFRTFLREAVAELVRNEQMTEARLAALLVGRWPSGAPLLRSPERDDPAMPAMAGDSLVPGAAGAEESQDRRRASLARRPGDAGCQREGGAGPVRG